MANTWQENRAPPGRCGYTIEYNDVEFWGDHRHGGVGDVCCWREIDDESDFCYWHKPSDDKSAGHIPSQDRNNPIRLDGAHLPNINVGDYPFTSDTVLNSASLQSIEAEECNLGGVDFNGGNLSNSTLIGCELSRSGLRRADLTEANLRAADLSGAHLREATIFDADLREINATVCSAPETEFNESELSGSQFTSAYLDDSLFQNVTAQNCDFSHANMTESDFQSSNIKGSVFSHSFLDQSCFNDSEISNTEFKNCDLSGANFEESDGIEADFSNVDGLSIHFTKAKVAYSNFTSADIPHSDFHDATAINTDFSDVDAPNADFSECNLNDAIISNADFRRSEFRFSSLEDAELESVDLRGANLDGSLLGGALLGNFSIDEETELGKTGYDSHSRSALITYRSYIRILEENSLDYAIPQYRILERKCKKSNLFREGAYFHGVTYSILEHTSAYGERPLRVLLSSGTVISVFAVLYAVFGSNSPSEDQFLNQYIPDSAVFGIEGILGGVAFSIASFAGVGTIDYSQHSFLIHSLSVIETLIGTLLIALLIFTLGRVATR